MKNLSLSTRYSFYLFNILEGKSFLLVSLYTMLDKESVKEKQNQIVENMYLDGSILTKEKFLYTLTVRLILQNIFLGFNIGLGVYLVTQYTVFDRRFGYSLWLLLLPWLSNIPIIINEFYLKSKLSKFVEKWPKLVSFPVLCTI